MDNVNTSGRGMLAQGPASLGASLASVEHVTP
jgi:hypothetical protein